MEEGVTLVEALITLAIALVVGVLLLVIIVNTSGLFYKQSSKLEQGLSLNDALNEIRESVRTSQAVVNTSGGTQLVVKVASVDSSGNIITSTFDYFVFYKEANTLRFKTFPDSQSSRKAQDQIFTTNLDSLLFEYFDGQIPPQQVQPNLAVKIKITLSLKQKAGAGIEQNVATAEANLRND